MFKLKRFNFLCVLWLPPTLKDIHLTYRHMLTPKTLPSGSPELVGASDCERESCYHPSMGPLRLLDFLEEPWGVCRHAISKCRVVSLKSVGTEWCSYHWRCWCKSWADKVMRADSIRRCHVPLKCTKCNAFQCKKKKSINVQTMKLYLFLN